MDSLHQRLLNSFEYLKDRGKIHTQNQFGEMLGKKRQDICRALKGDATRCTMGLLERIARTFGDDVNTDYLLSGDGSIEPINRDFKPHFPANVQAGVLSGNLGQVMDYEIALEPIIKSLPNYDYIIDVSGNSMMPAYYDGDCVACRRVFDSSELIPGRVYVFVTRDGAVLKRFLSATKNSVRVGSDNPEYRAYNIDSDSILSIAEVVGSISNKQHSPDFYRESILNLAKRIIEANNGNLDSIINLD